MTVNRYDFECVKDIVREAVLQEIEGLNPTRIDQLVNARKAEIEQDLEFMFLNSDQPKILLSNEEREQQFKEIVEKWTGKVKRSLGL